MSATETPLVTPDAINKILTAENADLRMREQVGKEAFDRMSADLSARDALIGDQRDALEATWPYLHTENIGTGCEDMDAVRAKQAAQTLLARTPADVGLDALTASKIDSVKARGFRKVGETFDSPDGKEVCIVWGSAVRWLDRDEIFLVMHPPCTTEAMRLGYQSAGAELERLRKEYPEMLAEAVAVETERNQLRRERDALRAQLADCQKTCAELVTDGNAVTLAHSLHRMESERNDARDQLATAEQRMSDVYQRVSRMTLLEGEERERGGIMAMLDEISARSTERMEAAEAAEARVRDLMEGRGEVCP